MQRPVDDVAVAIRLVVEPLLNRCEDLAERRCARACA